MPTSRRATYLISRFPYTFATLPRPQVTLARLAMCLPNCHLPPVSSPPQCVTHRFPPTSHEPHLRACSTTYAPIIDLDAQLWVPQSSIWTPTSWICVAPQLHTYIILYDITLHYVTLPYITLHYITLHYITRHCTTLHYSTLHCTTQH